jgi:hypothetical protein
MYVAILTVMLHGEPIAIREYEDLWHCFGAGRYVIMVFPDMEATCELRAAG